MIPTQLESVSVLVCDDHELLRRVVATILEDAGYHVRETASVREALDAIASARPDLVVLDMRLGGENGNAVIEKVRSDPALASTPILLVSGEVEHETGSLAGADARLPKPFDLEIFLETVEKLVRERHPV